MFQLLQEMAVVVDACVGLPSAGDEAITGTTEFQEVTRTNTIASFVDFIRRNPTSELIDRAVSGIYRILAARFPTYGYNPSIPKGNLKSHLLHAIRENQPLVVAFAPREVELRETCSWTTCFVELAGVGVRIDSMVPSIRTPEDGTWRASGRQLHEPIEIEAFGTAQHTWSCLSGPWQGSVAILSYYGSYGPEGRFFKVHSCVRFPQ